MENHNYLRPNIYGKSYVHQTNYLWEIIIIQTNLLPRPISYGKLELPRTNYVPPINLLPDQLFVEKVIITATNLLPKPTLFRPNIYGKL